MRESRLDDRSYLRDRSDRRHARRRRARSRLAAADGTPSAKRHGSPTFRAESCTSTETAPYAFVLGSAKKRSATSRCTITHQRSQRRRVLEGLDHERSRDVVREVGDELGGCRLELVDRRARARPPRPAERSRARRARRAAPARASDRARSRGRTRARSARRAREDAETRPDLEHDVRRVELAESPDDAEDVLVDEEVLAERLLGRDGHANPNAAAAFAWVCGGERLDLPRPAPRRGHGSCARRWRARSARRGSAAARDTGCRSRRGSCRAGTALAASRRAAAFGYVTLPANET